MAFNLYRKLFGLGDPVDASVTDFAEHGRAGGVSAGQPYKFVGIVGEATVVDEPDANTTYIGKAKVGSSGDTSEAIWQIKKVSVSGNVTTISYADGDTKYDNIFDNRASLSYS